MILRNLSVWAILMMTGAIVFATPLGQAASLDHASDAAASALPKEIALAPAVKAIEVEAKFDLAKIAPTFDPPWKNEDKIGDSTQDDESPSLALNPNGTFIAMWQVKNGSKYDIGYLMASRGGPWGGGYIQNASFDARNISVAAFDDGRIMAIAEDWSNRTRLVRFVSDDEGNTWKIFIMNMQQGAGGYKYVAISNPSLAAGNNKTISDYVFGTFDVVTNASAIKTVGVLFAYGSGGKTGLSYSHFNPQVADLKNPRCSIAKSKTTGFMRGYLTAEFTNGTNTDGVLLHNSLPSSGTWKLRQYSPAAASWEADTNILSEGSNVLWVMRSGAQANGNIISLRSTDDATNFGAAISVVGTGTNEQFSSAAMSGNNVWVAYADGAPTGSWKAVNSTDGGATWGTVTKVMSTTNTLTAYQGTGELAFTGGMPGTLWTDTRLQGTEGRNVYFSSAPDRYAPRVIWTYPHNGSINVTTFVHPNVVFSEAMNTTATELAISFNPSTSFSATWPTLGNATLLPAAPLTPSTKYVVTIAAGAKDVSNNALAAPYTFEFTTGLGDNRPPDVLFVKPKDKANVNGTFEVNITATDNIAVAKVELKVDATIISNFTKAPYTINWNSNQVADGPHNLTATAWDNSGNMNSTKILINVKNQDYIPPTVKIIRPVNNSAVSKNLSIDITASDNMGVAWVSVQVDAKQIANITKQPYSTSWNTRNETDGSHDLIAIASDAKGNKASDKVKITIANNDVAPPTVSFLKPTANTKVYGIVEVAIDAKDNLGIAKVELSIDSSIAKTFTSAPYSYNWSTTSVGDGNHDLNATAYDGAGNKGYAVITVEVKNGNAAPVISHTSVKDANEGSDVTIIALITDDGVVTKESINVTLGSGDIETFPMTTTGNTNEYSGVIPGRLVKYPKIGYYIYAEDNTNRNTKSGPYWINVKKVDALSMTMVYVIVVILAVVIVLVLFFLINKSRKQKKETATAPSSPFGMAPQGERISGPIPDFGIGDGRPEEGMGMDQRPPPSGFAPSQGYQQGYQQQQPMAQYEQQQQQPMTRYEQQQQPMTRYEQQQMESQNQQRPAQPQFQRPPPVPQVPQTAQPAKSGEDDWGFPAGGGQPSDLGADATVCPSCSTRNPAGSKWCTNCGGKLT